MNKKRILFLIALSFFPGNSYPQADNLTLEHLSVEQGLSQSSVLCILQDSKGYMWFGTQHGLNKFDGYTFTTYKRNPFDSTSISDNYILALNEDRDGNLWIGTNGGGLNRYDPFTETFTRFKHNPNDPHSLSHDRVVSIIQDRFGTIWIGTLGGGLNRLIYQRKSSETAQKEPM